MRGKEAGVARTEWREDACGVTRHAVQSAVSPSSLLADRSVCDVLIG